MRPTRTLLNTPHLPHNGHLGFVICDTTCHTIYHTMAYHHHRRRHRQGPICRGRPCLAHPRAPVQIMHEVHAWSICMRNTKVQGTPPHTPHTPTHTEHTHAHTHSRTRTHARAHTPHTHARASDTVGQSPHPHLLPHPHHIHTCSHIHTTSTPAPTIPASGYPPACLWHCSLHLLQKQLLTKRPPLQGQSHFPPSPLLLPAPFAMRLLPCRSWAPHRGQIPPQPEACVLGKNSCAKMLPPVLLYRACFASLKKKKVISGVFMYICVFLYVCFSCVHLYGRFLCAHGELLGVRYLVLFCLHTVARLGSISISFIATSILSWNTEMVQLARYSAAVLKSQGAYFKIENVVGACWWLVCECSQHTRQS
jgi:hypothetical protein